MNGPIPTMSDMFRLTDSSKLSRRSAIAAILGGRGGQGRNGIRDGAITAPSVCRRNPF